MSTRTKAMSASLTAEQRTLVDQTILRSFDALGRSPLKLAEIAWHVTEQCKNALPGGTYELYRWCDGAVQRLKREGRLELVRGTGGGWRLGSRRSKPEKPKTRPAKARKKAPAKAKRNVPAKAKKAPAKATRKATPKKASAKASSSYAPFRIDDVGEGPPVGARGTVRLSFFEWEWLEKQHGSIEIDGYYMNGPGVEGLVRAVMFANKIASNNVEGDSEGDACLLYFTNVKTATHVAQLAAAMIKDRTQLAKTIKIARERGFED